eukprot:2519925-Pleurochrysis_carterae.AAC.3
MAAVAATGAACIFDIRRNLHVPSSSTSKDPRKGLAIIYTGTVEGAVVPRRAVRNGEGWSLKKQDDEELR